MGTNQQKERKSGQQESKGDVENSQPAGRKSSDLPRGGEETDEGQGAAGIQGQYAGNDDQDPQAKKSGTAPKRKDPDTMNQNGSSHLALGSRDGNKSEQIP